MLFFRTFYSPKISERSRDTEDWCNDYCNLSFALTDYILQSTTNIYIYIYFYQIYILYQINAALESIRDGHKTKIQQQTFER